MNELILQGLLRAAGAFAVTLLALPVVAWIEGLRGAAAPGIAEPPRGVRFALATAIKLLEKRAPRALGADRPLHTAAPILAIVPAASVLAVIPVTPDDPVAASLPFVLGLPLLSTAAVSLAGYSGGSSLAHLAALRLVTLRLSVLVVVGAAALASTRAGRTLDLPTLVDTQALPLAGALPRWGVLVAPPSFLAALIALAVLAQHVMRARSDASLAVPWLGDATGPVLLGHRIFEHLDLLAGACLLAVLFLGGWHLPILEAPGPLVTGTKVMLALVGIVTVRNALPQLTHAVAVRVCWVVLLPLAVLGLILVDTL